MAEVEIEEQPNRSEELIQRALNGEKLDTDQRRDAITFLMALKPEMTHADHARMFGVSEGMIRKDKIAIRQKAADELSGEDVGLVISDINRTFEKFKQDILKGIKTLDAGTKMYLDYQRALVDYELKRVVALQSLGFYPKNLGVLQKNQFVFKSTVAKDGSIDTRAIDPKETKVIEGQRVAKALIAPAVVDPEDAKLRDALRDEFSDTPTSMKDAAIPSGDGDYEDGA